jgi:hypothetical protein
MPTTQLSSIDSQQHQLHRQRSQDLGPEISDDESQAAGRISSIGMQEKNICFLHL